MKFYLTNTASPLPALPFVTNSSVAINWEQATTTVRRALATTPQGANTAISQTETGETNPTDVALGQWVSPPIVTAGTLQGSCALVAAFQESDLAADMVIKFIVSVVASDGTVRRGIATSAAGTQELTTTLTGRRVTNTLGTNVACQVGDRIVVEVGVRATNTVTTTYTATLRYGGTDATDLASLDTGAAATTRPGYIEFTDPAVDALFTATPSTVTPSGVASRAAVGAPTVAGTGGTAKTILMVVGDKANLTLGDPVIRDRLIASGYTVVLASDEEPEFTGSYDGLIITDSCSAATIGSKYSTVAKPAVLLENGPWSGYGLGTGPQTQGVTQWQINTASELTGGLSGTVTVYSAGTAQNAIGTANLGAGGVVRALVGGSVTDAPFVTYEAGATLTTGGSAPARRVALGVLNGSVQLLTPDGFTLLDSAILWAFGASAGGQASIAAAGIAPRRAVGAATVTAGAAAVAPAGIAPRRAVGSPAVSQTVATTAVPSRRAVSDPAVTVGPVAVTATSVAPRRQVGAPAVAPGAVALAAGPGPTGARALGSPIVAPEGLLVAPPGVAPAAAVGGPSIALVVEPLPAPPRRAVGAPTVTTGPVDLAPAGVDPARAVGSPAVAPGPVDLGPAAVPSAAAVGAPALAVGEVQTDPAAVPPRAAVGAPTVTTAVDVDAAAVDPAHAVGVPDVAPGAATVAPAGRAPRRAVGLPLVSSGATFLVPEGAPSPAAVGDLVVQPGPLDVDPAGIATRAAVGAPAAAVGDVQVEPPGVEPPRAVGDLTVAGGPVDVDAGPGPRARRVGDPAVDRGPVLVEVITGVGPRHAVAGPVVEAGAVDLAPTGVPSAAAVLALPAFTVGPVDLLAGSVPPPRAVGDVDLLAGALSARPTGISSRQALGEPEVFVVVTSPGVPARARAGRPVVHRDPRRTAVRLSPSSGVGTLTAAHLTDPRRSLHADHG